MDRSARHAQPLPGRAAGRWGLLAVAVLLSGCLVPSDAGPGSASAARSVDHAPAGEGSAVATAAVGAQEPPDWVHREAVEPPGHRTRTATPVTVAAGGDVHGEPPIAGVLSAGGNPLEGVAPLLSAADLALVNLETAVGATGAPEPGKTFTFQADPALLDRLVDAGVDVVSLANNHALDYGLEALRETITLAEQAGLHVVGAGEDAEEAYAPALVEVGDTTVAVIGVSHVLPSMTWAATEDRPGLASAYDHDAAAAAVRRAGEVADRVVVMVHWGEEGVGCPVAHQLQLGLALHAAGANLIIGHHPHRLQGITHLEPTAIAWSLGNFVWYPVSEGGRRSGVLEAEIAADGTTTATLAPAFIDAQGRPQPLAGAAAAEIIDLVQTRSGPACGL